MTIRELVWLLVAATKNVAWDMPVVVNHKGESFEIGGVETDKLGGETKALVLTSTEDAP